MSFYPMSDEMRALQERYRERGLLTKSSHEGWKKSWNLFGRSSCFFMNWSQTGSWELLLANGHVLSCWLNFGREWVLLPKRQRIVGISYLMAGPLVLLFETHRLDEEG